MNGTPATPVSLADWEEVEDAGRYLTGAFHGRFCESLARLRAADQAKTEALTEVLVCSSVKQAWMIAQRALAEVAR